MASMAMKFIGKRVFKETAKNKFGQEVSVFYILLDVCRC
jgi:hypothetical protein